MYPRPLGPDLDPSWTLDPSHAASFSVTAKTHIWAAQILKLMLWRLGMPTIQGHLLRSALPRWDRHLLRQAATTAGHYPVTLLHVPCL
jgi:hypothetical protein